MVSRKLRLAQQAGQTGRPEALNLLRGDNTAAGRDRLAETLGRLADWGDPDACLELQHRAANGDEGAFYELHSILVAKEGASGWVAAVHLTGFTP